MPTQERVDDKREAEEQLEAMLLEGLNTHESELTRADWKAIRGEALAACAAPRTVQSRVIANDADRRANTEDT